MQDQTPAPTLLFWKYVNRIMIQFWYGWELKWQISDGFVGAILWFQLIISILGLLRLSRAHGLRSGMGADHWSHAVKVVISARN